MADNGWRGHAVAMADRLAVAGGLADPAWRAAFTAVPRHLFVPGQPLDVAYSARPIVTQVRPAPVAGGGSVALPSSSASAPGAMAVMLDRLAVRPGHRVLEIGTGTGYNAALLCHRLGADAVHSVDIDPDLVATARRVLASLGYHPTLATGDGYDGLPAGAPYDAILATCGISHIPPAWVRQLAPGGRIVAPMTGGLDAALLVLSKSADDEVVGRFDPVRVAFMPMRPELTNPLATAGTLGSAAALMAAYGTTDSDPTALVDPADDLALFLHLHIPGLTIGSCTHPHLGEAVTLSDAGSIAEAALSSAGPGRWTVLQRGPRRLWDTAEHAVRLWETLGRPARSRLGITALDDTTRQYVWLDEPDGPYSWPMPL
ncbi:MAG TPA: methyltransferase domain-containing protein [Mycobacteriales bacterium]|nr:methyltransferase domain-containing protein [Mycobacteriales bacterium]